jgi:hypothetical protein
MRSRNVTSPGPGTAGPFGAVVDNLGRTFLFGDYPEEVP